MHCKQQFAVVLQQVQANSLAQLGSYLFQPFWGYSWPNQTWWTAKLKGLKSNNKKPTNQPTKKKKKKLNFFCVLLSKDSKDRVMKVEACQLVLEPLWFLSSPTFSHPGDFMDDFKGKRVLTSKWCSILKTERFLPPTLIFTSPMWQRQPWVYSKSGKLIFCTENFYDSLTLGTVSPFHIFGVKSDKTTQQYFLSISPSSWTRL